jgi:hypothetical protein
MGHFDWDFNEKTRVDKPRILKRDKDGVRIDKNLRLVNKAGWLIDDYGNVIDNTGKVKFIAE